MSKHNIFLVPIKLEAHPNADKLSLVRVFGWTCVVNTEEWASRDYGIYIPPDYVVPETPAFDWLNGKNRIRVRRFRGVMSQGLLVPLESFPDVPTMQLAGNVNKVAIGYGIPLDAELFGVKRWEPVEKFITGGEAVAGPNEWCPIYDIESWHRYRNLLVPGEEVVITEKIHGANARFTHGFCGSRREWKRDEEGSVYWRAFRETPGLERFCNVYRPDQVSHPCRGFIFGEIYGWVQDLRYDMKQGEIRFRAFDIFDGGRFLDYDQFVLDCAWGEIPTVPELYRGPYSEEVALSLAGGKSTLASHYREGIVIKPIKERQDAQIGRVILKLVSDEYLEKSR